MLKKGIIFCVVLLIVASVISGCGQKAPETVQIKSEIIDPLSVADQNVFNWYQEMNQQKGNHMMDGADGYKYVIISAGEKPTGGYTVEVVEVIEEKDAIVVQARLKSPAKGEVVTMALTYPHILMRIQTAGKNVQVNLEEPPVEETTLHTGVGGIYIGQVDSNFIEVDLTDDSTFPEPNETMTFMLSEEVKGVIETLAENDTIIFDTYENDDGNWVIVSIYSEK